MARIDFGNYVKPKVVTTTSGKKTSGVTGGGSNKVTYNPPKPTTQPKGIAAAALQEQEKRPAAPANLLAQLLKKGISNLGNQPYTGAYQPAKTPTVVSNAVDAINKGISDYKQNQPVNDPYERYVNPLGVSSINQNDSYVPRTLSAIDAPYAGMQGNRGFMPSGIWQPSAATQAKIDARKQVQQYTSNPARLRSVMQEMQKQNRLTDRTINIFDSPVDDRRMLEMQPRLTYVTPQNMRYDTPATLNAKTQLTYKGLGVYDLPAQDVVSKIKYKSEPQNKNLNPYSGGSGWGFDYSGGGNGGGGGYQYSSDWVTRLVNWRI